MKKKQIPQMDLHGHTADEIFDLLDQFIRKHKHRQRVTVIVGKGRGIVKNKVLEYLKIAHYPWSYEKVHSRTNEGALIIELN